MVRWLERNGYDVSYFTGVDSARFGSEILDHKTFLSVGHDEYWSGTQRDNVEAARAAGVNLAFFAGNESFWKTRWEPSTADGSSTDWRTLVCYKETHANAKIDPTPVWTGTWRDPRFSPPADGGRPENAVTGTMFRVNSGTSAIDVPAADGKMRIWRNTSIASQAPGQTATLADGTLGYEWDEAPDNGFRPPGLVQLSSTTRSGVQVLQDYGSTYGSGTATHHLTLYRAPSGALVFGAGTIQWSWGLDGNHDRGGSTPDPRMQQATVNVLADMGAQPDTLQGDLVGATASTDTAPPSSAIDSPLDGSNVESGAPITISGTASDAAGESGGGQVGSVEVSTDGGTTWHPAQGRQNWTYSWTPGATGSATIKTRAADDSGNLETPSAGVTVNVTARTCPCSIWNDSFTGPEENDPAAVELGVKFRSDQAGFITGLRFYKTSGNTGTHLGHLWAADGTQLAEATFSGETASGWQQVSFDNPVAIDANTTYIASYHAPAGHYAATNGYFATGGFDSPPLHALGEGVDGPNGVYHYDSAGGSAFPTDTFQSSNYWVDVVFENTVGPDTTPPTITARSPADGATNVSTGANVTATFSEPMDPATINGTNFELRDPSERGRPRHRHLRRRPEKGDPRPEQRPPELDHLHGDREGRRRRRHRRRESRQRARRRLDLVLHHRGATAAAARRGPRRPDPGDLERRQPVQPLLRRDPAGGGAERVHRHRHHQRRRDGAESARRRDPRRRPAHRRPGADAQRLGAGGRQPDREPPGSTARRPAGPDQRRRHAGQRLPPGRHQLGARGGDRRPDDPVPRHGRPLHDQRRPDDRDALLGRDHRHLRTRR